MNKNNKLTTEFFEQPTLLVAKQLLGKYLVVKDKNQLLSGKIVETEAYIGEDDLACHAAKGRTPRSETLYGQAGTVYVYLIYGMYYCLNIVTEKPDFPAAVLIRAIEPITGIETMKKLRHQTNLLNLTSGPGKLCQAFGIDKTFNRQNIFANKIFIEDHNENLKPTEIVSSKRIGVDYAKHCKNFPWRFYIKKNNFVSQK